MNFCVFLATPRKIFLIHHEVVDPQHCCMTLNPPKNFLHTHYKFCDIEYFTKFEKKLKIIPSIMK